MKSAKRIVSLLLSIMMIAGMLLVASVSTSADTYRNHLINVILNSESKWKTDYWNGVLFFEDYNFDGKPEFVYEDYGGSMINVSNNVYYYSGGKLTCASTALKSTATSGYPGFATLYVNKTTGAKKFVGSWLARNGWAESCGGYYTLSFNGTKMTYKGYAASFISRDTSGKTTKEIYYDINKGYANLSGAKKISKSKYDSIVKSLTSGFTDAKSTKITIASYEWKKMSAASKRAALERSYDGYNSNAGKLATPKLSKFENVNAGVRMTASAVAGAVKYRFYGYTKDGWKKLGDSATTTFTYKTANSGKKYKFTVRCVDASGKEYQSGYNKNGFTTTFIGVPKLSSVKNAAAGVVLKWKKPTGAAYMRVFRKTGSGSWQGLGNTSSTTFTDKTAVAGKTYTYTIRCIDSAGKVYQSGYDTKGVTIKRTK